MVSDDELAYASQVLQLLIEQHGKDPAGGRTSELFDALVGLRGAYAAVKDAQAQGKADPQLLADLEAMIMISDSSLEEYGRETLAYAHLALARRKENPSSIDGLLSALKEAHESDSIGRMAEILDRIVGMGESSKKPGEILEALREFAKKEPELSGTVGLAMDKIRFAADMRAIEARANFMERLAGMKKGFPSASDLRAPKHAQLVKSGRFPAICKN